MAMTRDIRDKQNAQEKHYMHIVYLYIKIIFLYIKRPKGKRPENVAINRV